MSQASLLAFSRAFLERLRGEALSTLDVEKAIACVEQRAQQMARLYPASELKSYLDLSSDALRDGQGRDLLALLEVS